MREDARREREEARREGLSNLHEVTSLFVQQVGPAVRGWPCASCTQHSTRGAARGSGCRMVRSARRSAACACRSWVPASALNLWLLETKRKTQKAAVLAAVCGPQLTRNRVAHANVQTQPDDTFAPRAEAGVQASPPNRCVCHAQRPHSHGLRHPPLCATVHRPLRQGMTLCNPCAPRPRCTGEPAPLARHLAATLRRAAAHFAHRHADLPARRRRLAGPARRSRLRAPVAAIPAAWLGAAAAAARALVRPQPAALERHLAHGRWHPTRRAQPGGPPLLGRLLGLFGVL
jgi:hypothetical protein